MGSGDKKAEIFVRTPSSEENERMDRSGNSPTSDERQTERLAIIKLVIRYCFGIIIGLSIVFTIDIWFSKKDIFNSPVFVAITTIVGTTLTTAVGVVIGSSIN